MSAVDVLAVLDRAYAELYNASEDDVGVQLVADLREAHAAVAELVAASAQAVETTGVNATYREREAVRTRLCAALARVGGGK